ncbi:MAG: hypothetical protein QM503_03820 [Bacteroidota bacterium]
MNLLIAYNIVIIGITIAAWNAYVILWGLAKNKIGYEEKRELYSNIWHGIGLVLRAELVVIPAYLLYWHPGAVVDWLYYVNWLLTIYLVMGPLYDLIINILRYIHEGTPDILYVDNKNINALFLWAFKTEKAIWIFRLLLLLGNIGGWIYYLANCNTNL